MLSDAAADPNSVHNSYIMLAMFVELLFAFVFGCALISTMIDWIDKRGWRPKNKQRKL